MIVSTIGVNHVLLLCRRDKTIDDLKLTGLNLEDRGNMPDYLGIDFPHEPDNTIIMRQPHFIQQIINAVRLKPNAYLPPTPAVSSYILKRTSLCKYVEFSKHHRYA